jgi:hypothetical protein
VRREEAEAESRRLAAEHPERATHHWFAKPEANGSWVVVKVAAPPGTRRDPLREEIRADERPPTPDDPQTPHERNVGGNYAV